MCCVAELLRKRMTGLKIFQIEPGWRLQGGWVAQSSVDHTSYPPAWPIPWGQVHPEAVARVEKHSTTACRSPHTQTEFPVFTNFCFCGCSENCISHISQCSECRCFFRFLFRTQRAAYVRLRCSNSTFANSNLFKLEAQPSSLICATQRYLNYLPNLVRTPTKLQIFHQFLFQNN